MNLSEHELFQIYCNRVKQEIIINLADTRDYGDKVSVRSSYPRSFGWKKKQTSKDKGYTNNYIKEPGETYYDDYER